MHFVSYQDIKVLHENRFIWKFINTFSLNTSLEYEYLSHYIDLYTTKAVNAFLEVK